MKRTPHYEVLHHAGKYKVVVWDCDEKHKIVAAMNHRTYREAVNWGRAVKKGAIKLGTTPTIREQAK